MEGTDFLSAYLHYTRDTEPHRVYHRWSAIVAIGAALGRNSYIPFGHTRLYPNFYCMLLGEPGARKSSAIKLAKNLLSKAGYDKFSADRSSREKFLLDLGGLEGTDDSVSIGDGQGGGRGARTRKVDITDKTLWGSSSVEDKEPKEVFIVADEFNEFVSAGNVDFYTTLGNLWDWHNEDKPYEDKVKNSKSVSIFQPTVSLLGGNTQENFARAFPPEILGHGFLSRLLLIHGQPSGRKIAFPEPPPEEDTATIIEGFKTILSFGRREKCQITEEAKLLLEQIYLSWREIGDPRFKGYNTRRYTHLLKLCIITAAAAFSDTITEHIVVYANTMLSAVEVGMPQSIGEFGKSKNSDVSHKILSVLNAAVKPVNARDLWKMVHKDLDRMTALSDILQSLSAADKVQYVQGKGWLPKREVVEEAKYVDWSLLSDEERMML